MANKYLRKRLIPTQDVTEDLYTVPAANATICRSLRIINTSAVRAEITIIQEDGDAITTITLLDQHIVPPRSEYDALNGVPLHLEAGDVLSVLSTVSDTNFYLSYLEIDRN